MGSRPDMLRKFLLVLGFVAIVFGALNFIAFNYATIKSLNQIVGDGTDFWDKFLTFISSVQFSAAQALQQMAIGALCLYFARKLKQEVEDG